MKTWLRIITIELCSFSKSHSFNFKHLDEIQVPWRGLWLDNYLGHSASKHICMLRVECKIGTPFGPKADSFDTKSPEWSLKMWEACHGKSGYTMNFAIW